MNGSLPDASPNHSNADLFVWALWLAGGRDGYVDIEDVYWKCFELAPKRFAWRTRPEIPDLQKISVARRDVIKKQAAADLELMSAQEADVRAGKPVPSYNWRLTAVGVDWVERNRDRLERLYGGQELIPAPSQRPDTTRLRTVHRSSIFNEWQAKAAIDAELWELADLLECSPSSTREVWDLRLDTLELTARDTGDGEVEDFVRELRNHLKGKVR